MKIINKNWQRKIEIEDNVIYTLVFENKKYYRENIIELINQHKGCEGSYIFTDIFNIDINSKKVMTKIYTLLLKEVIEDITNYNELSTNIRAYFEKLIFNSSLEIEQSEELDMLSLLKLGNFKIHVENDDILEKFIKFLKVLTELYGCKIVFIIGLHSVFTLDEIKEIYKELCLNKINIINIEYKQFKNLSNENYKEIVYIFDVDNCEI